ncbi:MAG TPA: hypothetical protein VG826_10850 [Pirellulales bacterium]|nr:hypothetical protein [Pirellulales bacterium]
MATSKPLGIVFAALLLSSGQIAIAQPLLEEGEKQAEEPAELDAEELQRRELVRRRAQLEEERQLKLQEELMRLRGEQMRAEQEEIRRRDVMMRYALVIAIVVIVTTLVIAFARSRTPDAGKATKD